jgi:hydroxymethylbilane synthase
MAQAALERLGRTDRVAEVLTVEQMVPQVGQGALAVECRHDDDRTRSRLATIESSLDRRFVDLERAFLATLGGGCELPVGAHACLDDDGQLILHSFLSGPTGRWRDRRHGSATDHGWVVGAAREAAAAAGLA